MKNSEINYDSIKEELKVLEDFSRISAYYLSEDYDNDIRKEYIKEEVDKLLKEKEVKINRAFKAVYKLRCMFDEISKNHPEFETRKLSERYGPQLQLLFDFSKKKDLTGFHKMVKLHIAAINVMLKHFQKTGDKSKSGIKQRIDWAIHEEPGKTLYILLGIFAVLLLIFGFIKKEILEKKNIEKEAKENFSSIDYLIKSDSLHYGFLALEVTDLKYENKALQNIQEYVDTLTSILKRANKEKVNIMDVRFLIEGNGLEFLAKRASAAKTFEAFYGNWVLCETLFKRIYYNHKNREIFEKAIDLSKNNSGLEFKNELSEKFRSACLYLYLYSKGYNSDYEYFKAKNHSCPCSTTMSLNL